MNNFSDQHGRPISSAELIQHMSEAILANVIALHEGGVPRDDVRLIVGQDGGTVLGGEAMFQTPVTQRLSDEHARKLHQAVSQLLAAYEAGQLPASQLAGIRSRHNVTRKIQAVRDATGRP